MLGHNIGVWEKGEPAISYILDVWAAIFRHLALAGSLEPPFTLARGEWYLGHLPTMGAGGIALALG